VDADELDWNRTLREQWEFHRNHQLQARIDGLGEAGLRVPGDLYLHTKPATNGATR
jgi:hypothetical protein